MKKIIFALLLLVSQSAFSGVLLTKTRLVFEAGAKEASLSVRGDPDVNFLIQSWLDAGVSDNVNENMTRAKLPFAVVPGLASLGAGRQQVIRVLYEGQGLPEDRESTFWLNVQEIPAASKDKNVLQLAVRQRIRVLYRPKSLNANDAAKAILQTQWQLDKEGSGASLTVSNPTPYYVTLSSLTDGLPKPSVVLNAFTLQPFATVTVPLPGKYTDLSFSRVSDFGEWEPFKVSLGTTAVNPIVVEVVKDKETE